VSDSGFMNDSYVVPVNETIEPSAKPKVAARPPGASLANPNNKARKIQAIQFESDDDEGA